MATVLEEHIKPPGIHCAELCKLNSQQLEMVTQQRAQNTLLRDCRQNAELAASPEKLLASRLAGQPARNSEGRGEGAGTNREREEGERLGPRTPRKTQHPARKAGGLAVTAASAGPLPGQERDGGSFLWPKSNHIFLPFA